MSIEATRSRPPYRHQIQQIASNLTDGVILIDVDQTIRWANDAALAMHGVSRIESLGRTIDEYHANFQVRFRNYQSMAAQGSLESVAAGESFRDVVIEVTPLDGDAPKWVHRIRNLVLTDEAGNPSCVALVLHAVNVEFQLRGQFASSVESLPLPAAILRLRDQIVVGANQSFLDFIGLERAKVIARAPAEIGFLAAAEGCGGQQDNVLAAIAHATPLGLTQSRLALADGSVRQVLLAGQPIDFDAQRCLLFTFVDLGPQAPALVAARQVDHDPHGMAHALCGAAPTPLHVLDGDMRVLNVSAPWLEWLGYAPEAVIGRAIVEFMTPASAAHFESHTWPALREHRTVREAECQFRRETGDIVDAAVTLCATLDDAGTVTRAVATPVDITERKRSDARFATLFAMSPVPMIVRRLDDHRILDANDAFLAATGHTAQTVVGHLADELGIFETRAQRQHFEQELRAGGRPRDVEARVRTAGGEFIDCKLSAETVHMFGQACALLVLQDVTEQRRNETQLYQAIEMVMKDTSWFSRAVIEKLAAVRAPAGPASRMAAVGDLTRREREVLGLVSHGLSDSDIAEKLGLTRSTVRNHVATLYSKIGVHSRRNAIVWARERGINIAWPTAATANQARRPAAR
jgi:PAS domain S-box-containing protein